MYYFNRMSKRSVLWSSFLLSLLHWLYCIVVVRVITQYNSVCDSLQSGSWHTDFFCSYLNQTIGLPYSLLWYLIGGQSSGTCRQESAWTNEKTIWGELAYWHQAWRQREAVRGNSPNDRSLWTAAHYYNSCPFSVMYCIPSPTCLFYCLSFFSIVTTLHQSPPSFFFVILLCWVWCTQRESLGFFLLSKTVSTSSPSHISIIQPLQPTTPLSP